MNELRKEAEMALEALKANYILVNGDDKSVGLVQCLEGYYSDCFDTESVNKQTDEAITALRQALEQPDMGINRGVWDAFGNDGMQYPEECDLVGGETDCVEEPPNSTTDVVESTDSLSTLLWRDLKTDRQRADWLRLGMGYQTGVVAAAIQQELAMAYERLVGFQKIHAALKQPAQQEPVAIVDEIGKRLDGTYIFNAVGKVDVGQQLYTAPPKREWIGLTDEEASQIWDSHIVPVFGKNGINPIVFARAIEAKLKEKNT